MEYTVIGEIYGENNKITYRNESWKAEVLDDDLILFLFDGAMVSRIPVGPIGWYMERNMNNLLSVLCFVEECFERIISMIGDIPKAEMILDGCIG
jgi:hypothetical protein